MAWTETSRTVQEEAGPLFGAEPGPAPSRIPREAYIAALAASSIALHLVLRYGFTLHWPEYTLPLLVALLAGGIPLVIDLAKRLARGEFGSDLLAGASIVTAVAMGEYLVGTIVVLMLSGGTALEQYATHRASSVLGALAKRMPQTAHRRRGATFTDVALSEIALGDRLIVLPHEICPADGTVLEGFGTMDESYLTGEPFVMSKTPGAQVLSGSINGDNALTISVVRLPVDSRYAKIMQVMQASAEDRPRLRRIGDRLGAWYTPLAIAVALAGWVLGGDPHRFLAVMVIATPCPLLIAIPIAIIGAISVSARTGIIIKNPGVLEQIDRCRTLIFDKTGTLTYGKPALTEIVAAPGFDADEVLRLAASLERYSKHPLAGAILIAAEAKHLALAPVRLISEKPGEGLQGVAGDATVEITGRGPAQEELPAAGSGLECLVFIRGRFAASSTRRRRCRRPGMLAAAVPGGHDDDHLRPA